MGLRGWVKKLEHAARGEMVDVPQRDGTVKRFTLAEAQDAYLNMMDRLGAGEDAPPEHPFLTAVRNSSEPVPLFLSAYAHGDPEDWTAPVPDLSEP
jgi:hypothetical protein